jgi:hypothetical protein
VEPIDFDSNHYKHDSEPKKSDPVRTHYIYYLYLTVSMRDPAIHSLHNTMSIYDHDDQDDYCVILQDDEVVAAAIIKTTDTALVDNSAIVLVERQQQLSRRSLLVLQPKSCSVPPNWTKRRRRWHQKRCPCTSSLQPSIGYNANNGSGRDTTATTNNDHNDADGND